MLVTDDPADPGTPEAYRQARAANGEDIAAAIRATGGEANAIEADLADPAVPRMLFDLAEAHLGAARLITANTVHLRQSVYTYIPHPAACPASA